MSFEQEDAKEESPEERRRREHKADSIRRMLTESNTNLTAEGAHGDDQASNWVKDGGSSAAPTNGTLNKAQERKEREHILAMNQILARQVMEKSRLVAGKGREGEGGGGLEGWALL